MLETILTSAIVAVLTAGVTAHWRLRTELRTEFMAEEAVKKLLRHKKWEKRSFAEIQRRVGGFEDEELRKLLVRAGAVRFYGENGVEFWVDRAQ